MNHFLSRSFYRLKVCKNLHRIKIISTFIWLPQFLNKIFRILRKLFQSFRLDSNFKFIKEMCFAIKTVWNIRSHNLKNSSLICLNLTSKYIYFQWNNWTYHFKQSSVKRKNQIVEKQIEMLQKLKLFLQKVIFDQ